MARIIPKRVLDDIRFRNDIVEVVGSYLTLKRTGSTFKTLCPFHKEKTPSFHVNPQKQIFRCFGCGVGGDVFAFMQHYESVDFVTAARMLAERAGIPIELDEDAGAPDGASKDALYRIHEGLAAFYQRCLQQMTAAGKARSYLEQRDLDEAIEPFRIGYAPNRWNSSLQWAEKHRFTPEQLDAAGVVLKRDRPDARRPYYDRFRDRVMFPIRDEQDRVIGFSARLLDQEAKAAKYINSPETALFRKSRVLYAMGRARRAIVEAREAIVCEGQIDVIRCHLAGLSTAVAAQGTAFTEDHARVLRRYADSVVIVFDSDHAGQDASVKAARQFMAAGLAVRVAALPPEQDPDSFIRAQGVDAFRRLIQDARSVVAFQHRVLAARDDVRSQAGSMRASRALLDTIRQSPNAVLRARMVQEAAERLSLPVSALQEDLRHLQLREQRYRVRKDEEAAGEPPRPPPHPAEEVQLCEYLVHIADTPGLADLVKAYLPLDRFRDPVCRELAASALEAAAGGSTLRERLREREDPSGELQRLAAQVEMTPAKTAGREATVEDAVKDLILYVWRRELKTEREGLHRRARSGDDDQAQARLRQITYDLKSLRCWDDGAPIIEIELGD